MYMLCQKIGHLDKTHHERWDITAKTKVKVLIQIKRYYHTVPQSEALSSLPFFLPLVLLPSSQAYYHYNLSLTLKIMRTNPPLKYMQPNLRLCLYMLVLNFNHWNQNLIHYFVLPVVSFLTHFFYHSFLQISKGQPSGVT